MSKIKGYIMKNNETKADQKKPNKAGSDKDSRTPSDIRREIYDEMLDMEMMQSSVQDLFY